MKSKSLIQYLEKIDEISPNTEIKFFVNNNVYDVGLIRSDGMIFGVNRNSSDDIAGNTDKLQEQLRKSRKKAKRWKRKYLELRYKLDKDESEEEGIRQVIKDATVIERSLCDSCINNGCIFQSGIVRSHCDFYKAESEE